MTEATGNPVLVALPNADVVWGERSAPDRAVLTSIPEPSSGFRWMDAVRLIPVAVADLEVDGVVYEVLAAPERVEDSGIPTALLVVAVADTTDLAALMQTASEHGWRTEDWTDGVVVVCTDCAGTGPGPDHRHEAGQRFERHELAVAAQPSELETMLRMWAQEVEDRRMVIDLDEAP
jgi:hypothetical protein